MSRSDNLTASDLSLSLRPLQTVDKLRRLMTAFTRKPFEQIDENFSFHDDVHMDKKEFQTRLVEAIRESFGVVPPFPVWLFPVQEVVSAKEIAQFNTLGDLVSFLNSFNLVTDVLLKKATLASMHQQ